MDFRFTAEEEAFRKEVHDFIESECPSELMGKGVNFFEQAPKLIEWRGKVAKKGWVAPAWPKEYGGAGMTVMEQFIYNLETAIMRAPSPIFIGGLAVAVIGPTIIIYGSEEQKQEHITKILAGQEMWCQGFSEPESGSDLASLQTRAVKDGDDYVINGTKVWSSNAHKANWCFLLARTDPDAPKHKGISYFITPMDAPGISVRPLINMANEHVFNEIVFEDVRIPAKYLVGEENRGWYIGMTTLDFERSNISSAAGYRRSLEQLIGYAKETATNGHRMIDEPGVRGKLAELAIENTVGRNLSLRVASMQERNQIPNYESSAAKVYHSEYGQRLARAGVQILGLYGILDEESKHARLRGRFARTYLTSIGSTIAAGTSEIQRGIIAQRGLGLSRI